MSTLTSIVAYTGHTDKNSPKFLGGYERVLTTERKVVQDDLMADLETIEYLEENTGYKLEYGQCFIVNHFIENFSNKLEYKDGCTNLLGEFKSRRFTTADYSQIDSSDYRAISHLCIFQNGKCYIQKITFSMFIVKEFLSFSGEPSIKKQSDSIQLKKADATYCRETDTLRFRNARSLKSIFPWIGESQRTATDKEVQDFLANDFLSIETGFNLDNVKQISKSKIPPSVDKLNLISSNTVYRQKTIAYAKPFLNGTNILQNDGLLHIHSDNDLRRVLDVVNEMYYKSGIFEEKRVSNSSRSV